MKKKIISLLLLTMVITMMSAMSLSTFGAATNSQSAVILLKAKVSGKRAVELSWTKADNATKYVLYGARCGNSYKKIATLKSNTYTVKKVKKQKLKAHKKYKFYVVAYNGAIKLAKSRSLHFITANTSGKYGNVTKITATKKSLSLKVGETGKVGAKVKIFKNKKHISKVHGLAKRYISKDSRIAKVSSTGTVTAVSKGKTIIYIQDIGGLYCKTTVNVSEDEDNPPGITTFTVNFDLNGVSGTAPSSQTIEEGKKATQPTPDPSAEDYIFEGWFKDPSCNTAWNFDTDVVTTNTTIYAKWTAKGQVKIEKSGEATSYKSLADFRDNVNGIGLTANTFANYTVTLLENVDLNGVNWIPIGTDTNPFSGTFEGQNYTITNLSISGRNGAEGLFGYVIGEEKSLSLSERWDNNSLTYNTFEIEKDLTCSVKNLKVKNANIETLGEKKATGIIGSVECAFIYNISIENTTINGYKGVGGILGNVNGCVVQNCSTDNKTTVTASVYNVGGIVGVGSNAEKNVYSKHGNAIIGCSNAAKVTINNKGNKSGYIGGIVGSFNAVTNTNAFISCKNEGTIAVTGDCNGVGGIVGDSYNNGADQYFVNCINDGAFVFSEEATCIGVGGIAQKATIIGVNLINNADISAAAEIDVSGILSNAPQTPAFYNCINNGKLENKNNDKVDKVYDISSKSKATIGVLGDFATVSDLNNEISSRNEDKGIVRNFIINATVSNHDTALIVPKNAESINIKGNCTDSVEFESGSICSTIVYANNLAVNVNNDSDKGISVYGDNNVVTVNAKISGFGINGNNSKVTINKDIANGVSFGGDKASAEIASGVVVGGIGFDGEGDYTVTNRGRITHETTLARGTQHIIGTMSPCHFTIHNYGVIDSKEHPNGVPTAYVFLFYGNCDADVYAYNGSEIDSKNGMMYAASPAQSVVFHYQDGAVWKDGDVSKPYTNLARGNVSVDKITDNDG